MPTALSNPSVLGLGMIESVSLMLDPNALNAPYAY